MTQIWNSLLKKRLIKEIDRIGMGICEILVDIELSFGVINTIEYDMLENSILIHVFEFPNYDFSYDFDELDLVDRIKILNTLKTI